MLEAISNGLLEGILQAFVAALISLVVSFGLRKGLGGTISSIGVHDSSGKLLPLTQATLLVSLVAGGAAIIATLTVTFLVSAVGFAVTFIVAEVVLVVFLRLVPYDRTSSD